MSKTEQGRRQLLDMLGEDASMPAAEVLRRLERAEIGSRPTVALALVAARPDEFRARFLDEVAQVPEVLQAKLEAMPDDRHAYFLHAVALYFLALWQEGRAFAPLCGYLAADSDLVELQLDEIVTDDLPAILARCYDGGSLADLRALIEDEEANLLVREAALTSLVAMNRLGKLPREAMVSHLAEIGEALLDRQEAAFGPQFVLALAYSQDQALRPSIQRWLEAGLVDADILDTEDIDATFSADPGEITEQLLRHERFGDLAGYLSDWAWFNVSGPDELGNLSS